MGGVALQPGYDGKPCGPKTFKANQIAWFLYTKFLRKGLSFELIFCIAVQHHDWNLKNKFWLLMVYGVLSKVSIKVKLMFFKIQKRNSFINMQTWNDRNVLKCWSVAAVFHSTFSKQFCIYCYLAYHSLFLHCTIWYLF